MTNENIIHEFGLRIKQLRTGKGISQEKLSFETGFHRTYIGMIERGERNISLSHIAVFAKYFEMTVSDLLNFSSLNPAHSYHNYTLKNKE
ncbi:helix-turn-helix transcriptional regulator [Flectobacillus sp. DC10W]|uniref:Helix-turn-helix transcriptional regulator n=1 Tax=Flectobacillus longus TaxID=2984207 RepID=A0ABT6YKM8_9BACT|nr:helix-turn-helix transcriptional regulator [Flectobacillus longus]MDI9864012.1 helix-turn-helix transcriptional regulator [Flectobacillus longus]